MSSRAYPEDVDCVWLASDRDGHVGAFATGGAGPIPSVLLDIGEPEIEDLEEMICRLPKTSNTRGLISIERPDGFAEMAERGVFVYDWSDAHRTASRCLNAYEPVITPASPITLDSLPGGLRRVSAEVKFDKISFSDGALIDVCAYERCSVSNPRR